MEANGDSESKRIKISNIIPETDTNVAPVTAPSFHEPHITDGTPLNGAKVEPGIEEVRKNGNPSENKADILESAGKSSQITIEVSENTTPKGKPTSQTSVVSPIESISQTPKETSGNNMSFQNGSYSKHELPRSPATIADNLTPLNVIQTNHQSDLNSTKTTVKPHNPFVPVASNLSTSLSFTKDAKPVSSNVGSENNAYNKPEIGTNNSGSSLYGAPVAQKAESDEPEKIQSRIFIYNKKSDVFLELLRGLRTETIDTVTESPIDEVSSIKDASFDVLHFCIALSDSNQDDLIKLKSFFGSESQVLKSSSSICLHFDFGELGHWNLVPEALNTSFSGALDSLQKTYAEKVTQCSFIRKYSPPGGTPSKTSELEAIKKDINGEISRWPNLHTIDFGLDHITSISDISFPDSLRSLTIGGGHSLESLSGLRVPSKIVHLNVSNNAITSVEYMGFPQTLRNIDFSNNKIYFLHGVDFPQHLKHLDVSRNRIDNLKSINFPKNLTFLSIANNPIECIKGVRFPESIEHLDASCLPNESMTGIKFPDRTRSLNLQSSMTNTRGLKLPPFVENLNLACNGVNSINPLKLPNSIQRLFLTHNNIKTLNKVAFPLAIRELYLGNNSITTLKNVQFPPTLEVLDIDMDPHNDDNEKFITSLKDVFLPMNLRVLRLGYHSIKSIEAIDFPYSLEELSLPYNDLRIFRNVKFGPSLHTVDLSGNQDLVSLDNVYFPDSLRVLKLPSLILNNLPGSIVERANKGEIKISKSMPYTI